MFKNKNIRIKTKGYNGCSEMLRKGANQLGLFHDLGCTNFVICHDADRNDPKLVRSQVLERIVKPSGLHLSCCIVVPVQEIEAWILADISAISNIIKSWKPSPIMNPESYNDPKEYLEMLSEGANYKPRYDHVIHNPKVANYLDCEVVKEKCPSFLPLYDLVTGQSSSS